MSPNPYLVSRLAKILDAADFLQLFENTDRYTQQSKDTRDGARAEPPPRAALSRKLNPA